MNSSKEKKMETTKPATMFYLLVPLPRKSSSSDEEVGEGVFLGREVFHYISNPRLSEGDVVNVYRDTPSRMEYYRVQTVLHLGDEVFIITEKEPIRVEYIDNDDDS